MRHTQTTTGFAVSVKQPDIDAYLACMDTGMSTSVFPSRKAAKPARDKMRRMLPDCRVKIVACVQSTTWSE